MAHSTPLIVCHWAALSRIRHIRVVSNFIQWTSRCVIINVYVMSLVTVTFTHLIAMKWSFANQCVIYGWKINGQHTYLQQFRKGNVYVVLNFDIHVHLYLIFRVSSSVYEQSINMLLWWQACTLHCLWADDTCVSGIWHPIHQYGSPTADYCLIRITWLGV